VENYLAERGSGVGTCSQRNYGNVCFTRQASSMDLPTPVGGREAVDSARSQGEKITVNFASVAKRGSNVSNKVYPEVAQSSKY
jgi:hypothetical protein